MDSTLGGFFATMALDPNRFASFLSDPESAMRAAGLSDEVRELLRRPDQDAIADRLSVERGGPISLPCQAPGLMNFSI